ncbi:TetR/AcrR family transcriptional regulator [Kordiimonas pumila]|uniref:TetR/AcrR family transcriptional regulator n=1 Tax=Kordiimonas pumila TaxID=2161677 RepID=A0ABV7D9K7_9PROT|nr:TetR/AcrR family transcriptional regulator [Kordiimonas pumila]
MSSNKKSEITKREILDAAWGLVAEKGADVSVSEIAKAAGVSRQAVYLHFASRGGLLIALVKRADERFGIKQGFFDAAAMQDPAVRLDMCLSVWFRFVVEILPVATDLIRLRATDADAAHAWQDRMSELRLWYQNLVKGLQEDGALKPDWTVDTAADYLWAASSVQALSLLAVECGWGFDKTSLTLKKTISDTLLA